MNKIIIEKMKVSSKGMTSKAAEFEVEFILEDKLVSIASPRLGKKRLSESENSTIRKSKICNFCQNYFENKQTLINHQSICILIKRKKNNSICNSSLNLSNELIETDLSKAKLLEMPYQNLINLVINEYIKKVHGLRTLPN